MPYRITWEPGGVYREYFGDVTIAERLESFEKTCLDPRFDGLDHMVVDYLAVRSYEITSQTSEEIAAFHVAPLWTNPRIAIAAVTDRADLSAAVHRFMAQGFITVPYRVFDALEQARAWIGARAAAAAAPVAARLRRRPQAAPSVHAQQAHAAFDRPLQPQDALALASLSSAELAAVDATVLASVSRGWCRSAVVVARAVRAGRPHRTLAPSCYAERLLHLAAQGRVEVRGDLRRSRECLVRWAGGR